MKRFLKLMYAPCIYLRMLAATLAFSIISLVQTSSITISLYYGIICLLLMQAGYLGGVLFMIWREPRSIDQNADAPTAL
ncbi:hypothetical protein [Neorhizobium sp. S3-V5DH]|uniref:hypothetical protein n=1 Tax=Neorhizobium sp. S3-V5DH TaxID=2485166 RepID=UPI001051EC1A|nr:hypothetical protein [Neorhizobium sp. S3-V5DH]TCV68569.1 hypothetical protein EDE09_1112 [Neorhizobium sp. S3-V5DH]